jgi:hypothetical protein
VTTYEKDPQAVADYAFDWSQWLTGGDTIASFTVVAETGLTIDAVPAPSESGGVITYWVSGGTLGEEYTVTCHIVTAAGREEDHTDRFVMVAK